MRYGRLGISNLLKPVVCLGDGTRLRVGPVAGGAGRELSNYLLIQFLLDVLVLYPSVGQAITAVDLFCRGRNAELRCRRGQSARREECADKGHGRSGSLHLERAVGF